MRSTLRLAVIPALSLFSNVAAAAPLELAACDQLRQELTILEKAGARSNLAKGTGWAMANLKPEQLSQIEQLIDNDAQFLFRCPQPKKQFDPTTEALMEHGTGSDPDPDAPKADAVAPKADAVAPKLAPKRKPAAVQSPASPVAADASSAPVSKPAPKLKSKAVDAFVPPEPSTKAAGAATSKQTAPQ